MRSALFIICIALMASVSPPAVYGAVEKRRVIHAPRPEYPIRAREQHLSGSGLFALHIRTDGRVERVETVQSIGHRILDAAAIAAFRQWVFPHYDAPWTLGVPIRYVDGPPRIDDAMRRPAAPNSLKLITIFSRSK
jgi:TonB family protein